MITEYYIKPGDTINKILDKHRISAKEFKKENDVDDLMLIGNQMILVPLPQQSSIQLYEYKTDVDDTLTKISEKFNVTRKELQYFNNIYNLILSNQQKIVINTDSVSQGFLVEFETI